MLQPHQQRVVDEKNELDTKIHALDTFIATNPYYHDLASDEKEDLNNQFTLMHKYSYVLARRISRF